MTKSDNWITVASLPLDLDNELLGMELDRYRVKYSISKADNECLLQVSRQQEVPLAFAVLKQYQNLASTATDTSVHGQAQRAWSPSSTGISLAEQAKQVPVVVVILVLGLLGALLETLLPSAMHWFTFQDYKMINQQEGQLFPVAEAFGRGQYWRLLTPAFLHFGIAHVVFNCLWIWVFGRPIELLVGKTNFILVALGIAVSANVGQYLWEPNHIFGGLSGVVYGLLGYIWVRNSIAPHPLLQLPSGLVIIMLSFLLIGWLGIIDIFLNGGVANGAHIIGLLVGMLFGRVAGLGARKSSNNGK